MGWGELSTTTKVKINQQKYLGLIQNSEPNLKFEAEIG